MRFFNPNFPLSRHTGEGRYPAMKKRREADILMMSSHLRGDFINHLDSGLRRNDVIFSNEKSGFNPDSSLEPDCATKRHPPLLQRGKWAAFSNGILGFNYLMVTILLATPLLAQAEPTERQLKLLAINCLSCHARGHTGVPALGNADDWKTRNRKSEDSLLRSVIEGSLGMPPSGYCAACNEADLRVLVREVAGLEGGK